MNQLNIVFDSLKFYKLKNETTTRILFVLLYIIFLVSFIFPIGKPLNPDDLNNILLGDRSTILSVFNINYILFLVFSLVIYLVTSFIGLIYANCYVMQSLGFPNKKAILASLRALPKLIIFLLLMITPVALSSIFLFIPLIYIFYALFFVPMLISEGKQGVFEAIITSFNSTKGIKYSLFFSQVFLYFIMNIPITLFSYAFYNTQTSGTISEYLLMAFLKAAYVLMSGRLVGNLYLLVMRNVEKDKKVSINLFYNPSNKSSGENASYDENNEEDDEDDEDLVEDEEVEVSEESKDEDNKDIRDKNASNEKNK